MQESVKNKDFQHLISMKIFFECLVCVYFAFLCVPIVVEEQFCLILLNSAITLITSWEALRSTCSIFHTLVLSYCQIGLLHFYLPKNICSAFAYLHKQTTMLFTHTSKSKLKAPKKAVTLNNNNLLGALFSEIDRNNQLSILCFLCINSMLFCVITAHQRYITYALLLFLIL